MSIDSRWFAIYIRTKLGETYDCYITKFEKDSTISSFALQKQKLLMQSKTGESFYDMQDRFRFNWNVEMAYLIVRQYEI